jgi:hypothetical protein
LLGAILLLNSAPKVKETYQPTAEAYPESGLLIDVKPAVNIQCLIVIVLRLMAVDFLLRIIIQLTTPLLVSLGIYDRYASDNVASVGWVVVVALAIGAVLLWVLALPVARLIARGVPQELSLGNLSLADCYSVAFIGLGVVYVISHLPGVWNWVRVWIHGPRFLQYGDGRGYETANALLPFLAGIVLLVMGRKWAVKLGRKHTQGALAAAERSQNTKTKSQSIVITVNTRP